MMIRRGTVAEGVFDKYDADGNGSISSEEFQMMCYELDHCVTDEEVEIAVKVINSSGSGEIKKDEFVKWWKLGGQDRWKEVKLDEEELKVRKSAATTFHKFDSDSSGSIEAKEFDAFYANLVESKLTTDSKDDVLGSLDKDKNGSIQFSEYVQWLDAIGTITNWVRVLPPLASAETEKAESATNVHQNYWAQYCSFPHASKAVIGSIDGKQAWGTKGDWNTDANELKSLSTGSLNSKCSIGGVAFGAFESASEGSPVLLGEADKLCLAVIKLKKVFLAGIGKKVDRTKLANEVHRFAYSLQQGGY
uniref:Calmodulin like myosin light chain n=1 Tax=Bigelowiella natans TaxID=227086 RepID=Q5YES4_BIGNA|nr:calmodulin like myosin light chain [Bigelowiella natans]|eukprot:jgi/Bigna1/92091/estExt_fgenesh1_pm.C_20021